MAKGPACWHSWRQVGEFELDAGHHIGGLGEAGRGSCLPSTLFGCQSYLPPSSLLPV